MHFLRFLFHKEKLAFNNSPFPIPRHLLLPIPMVFLCLSLPCSELQRTSFFRLHHLATHTLWVSVGLDKGKQWEEFTGWEGEDIRQFISLPLSFPHGPFFLHCSFNRGYIRVLASMRNPSSSAAALTWTSLSLSFPPPHPPTS